MPSPLTEDRHDVVNDNAIQTVGGGASADRRHPFRLSHLLRRQEACSPLKKLVLKCYGCRPQSIEL